MSFISHLASGMNTRAVSSWSTIRRLVPFASPFSRALKSTRDSHRPEILHNIHDWKEYKKEFDPSLEFNVVTFNVLAPVYKRLQSLNLETGNRKRESQNPELWRARANKTLQFFRDEVFPHTEILGMQEFWTDPQYRGIFERDFQQFGYDVRMLQRTGSKLDAVVIAVKKDAFDVLGSLNVVLCTLSDRVALVLWLRHKATGKHFIVANTHLSFPHSALDKINQLRQMATLTNAMEDFARANQVSSATRMIMGDFNVEYTSRVCEHLRSLGYISCFEVSSPLNPRLTPHSMEDPHQPKALRKRTLRFVSHRNHRNEDVGVDHIFVRAESPFLESATPVVSSTPTSNAFVDHTQLVHEQHSEDHHTKNEESYRVFVDNSRVLPLKVPCTDWENNFMVSDHRPVGATLILAHPRLHQHHSDISHTSSSSSTTSAATGHHHHQSSHSSSHILLHPHPPLHKKQQQQATEELGPHTSLQQQQSQSQSADAMSHHDAAK